MAHFATLDSNNKVISVEVVNNAVITDADGKEQEQLGINFLEQIHGSDGVTYKQTSYNSNIRKNYAAIGGTYDLAKDAFIDPSPIRGNTVFNSWILNDTTCQWEPPVAYPTDGKPYYWEESSTSWKEHPETEPS